jgi:hypothetical protein
MQGEEMKPIVKKADTAPPVADLISTAAVVHPEPEQKRFDPKELNKIINEVHYFQD